MTDVLIIGSGIAGLYTALHIDRRLKVLIVTKESVDLSNSWLAQGGIAAAISKEDDPQIHFEDTMIAGAGLCDEAAVRVLVDEGPQDIDELVRLQVPFDLTEEGDLAITREGGHTRNRIVHAGGDATGRETVKVLAAIAAGRDNISFLENTQLLKLLTDESGVCGALLYRVGNTRVEFARSVVLCTGGIGQIYSQTTNPSVATGDGISACVRAGAAVKHMEFIQFHPTSLYSPGAEGKRAFLISEAVRGEGGQLKNSAGKRFMVGKHPMAELAPRDIVARAIVSELQASGDPCVYIDVTSRDRTFLETRFPTIFRECLRHGIDISQSPIPVCPAQHYLVGGVTTDLFARASIPGLYAVGETACTGVHGANRLASNSMLECLVFGRRAALHISGEAPRVREIDVSPRGEGHSELDAERIKAGVRAACDRDAGVIRSEAGLRRGMAEIEALLAELAAAPQAEKSWWEARNMAVTALEVFRGALARTESMGTHFRED